MSNEKTETSLVSSEWYLEVREQAFKYVDTLLGRANRDKIPEDDARQALEYFEEAKRSNAGEDYKAACSYFETSFLLNPKLTTLISTANMHLKLRNPTVAAEIYMRLLQNPAVPQREREVALRKLAVCETVLGEQDWAGPLEHSRDDVDRLRNIASVPS